MDSPHSHSSHSHPNSPRKAANQEHTHQGHHHEANSPRTQFAPATKLDDYQNQNQNQNPNSPHFTPTPFTQMGGAPGGVATMINPGQNQTQHLAQTTGNAGTPNQNQTQTSQRLLLSLRCEGFTKTIYLMVKVKVGDLWVMLGSTEEVEYIPGWSAHNFSRPVTVDYFPMNTQQLQIIICYKGAAYCSATCELPKVVHSTGPFCLPMPCDDTNATVQIRAQPFQFFTSDIGFLLSADHLKGRKSRFPLASDHTPDAFIQVSRQTADGPIVIHTTKQKHEGDPNWAPFILPVSLVNAGEDTIPLKFDVYNANDDRKILHIGAVDTTTAEIKSKQTAVRSEFPIINPRKSEKKKYKHSGLLDIKMWVIPHLGILEAANLGYKFVPYLVTDFSSPLHGSRSNPLLTATTGSNPYLLATQQVTNILLSLSLERNLPYYGFGTKSLHSGKPFVITKGAKDVEGILHGYTRTLEKHPKPNDLVEVHHVVQEARYIAETMHRRNKRLKRRQDRSSSSSHEDRKKFKRPNYLVVGILTDAKIHDVSETIEELQKSHDLPMSVVVIRVGTPSPQELEEFNHRQALITSRKKTPNIHFVDFHAFLGDPTNLSSSILQGLSNFNEYIHLNELM